MALYFSTKLSFGSTPLPEVSAAHPSLPVFCVGSATPMSQVVVFSEDGEVLGRCTRPSPPTVVCWHPTLLLLVVGWTDGKLTLWADGQESVLHLPQHENQPITALSFSIDPTTLCSCARNGTFAAWSVNPSFASDRSSAGAQLLWYTQCEIPITSLVLLNSGQPNDEAEVRFLGYGADTVFYLIDDSQQCFPLQDLGREGAPVGALWDPEHRTVVMLTQSHSLALYALGHDWRIHNSTVRKIASGPQAVPQLFRLIHVGPGVVATASGEDVVRIFNIQSDSMCQLRFPVDATNSTSSSVVRICSITAIPHKGMIAAGTHDCRIAVWSHVSTANDDETDWQRLTDYVVDASGSASIERIMAGYGGAFPMIQRDNVSIFHETLRKRKWGGTAMAVQVAPDTVVVESLSGTHFTIRSTTGRIKNLDIVMPHVGLWTGKFLELYALAEASGSVSLLHKVEHASPAMALHSDGFLLGQGDKVQMFNYQQHKVQALSFSEQEGPPALIHAFGDYAVIITTTNAMKICRVSARDVKMIGPTRQLFPGVKNVQITSCKVNARGKKVALFCDVDGGHDTHVRVYDTETDQIQAFDFRPMERMPSSICWGGSGGANTSASGSGMHNEVESLLLCVETQPLRGGSAEKSTNSGSKSGKDAALMAMRNIDGNDDADDRSTTQVSVLFSAPQGVIEHNTFFLKRQQLCLVGCTVPNIALCAAPSGGTAPSDHRLELKRLRDFEGMTGADSDVKLRDALMQFSYFTTLGNMDEAFKAVKTVKDTSVWVNLAKMCVRTRRLDVAEVCLANTQDAVAARALRESKEYPEIEARLATLATSLNMLEEAERLYKKCDRHDLLTELYIACGKWELARKHAESQDRIRIYPVLHRYAQHKESIGEIDEALRLYDQAKSIGHEGPRLLCEYNRWPELRQLVHDSEEKELLIWWAQYMESNMDHDEALSLYQKANDGYNVVRLCALPNAKTFDLDKAEDIIVESRYPNASGAAYFIAKVYEGQQKIDKALQFYDKAGAFKSAIKLAKDNDLYGEIISLALKCRDRHVALEVAGYFEERQLYDKAAQLYQSGGDKARAIDVCVKGGLYEELHRISESLESGSAADDEMFITMAEHFMNSGHFQKAVQMFVFGKGFDTALNLCVEHDIKLTDQMAEAMTLPKGETAELERYRSDLLLKVAKVAKRQHSYHLACKKYTQAGDRKKAMDMLLRSGDTEKITFFANHSRNDEIYIMAANYLQSQNWAKEKSIFKNIVSFYTKAKAFESLAGFYQVCAQHQIDVDRDYETALMILREGQKALDKGGDGNFQKKEELRKLVELVEMFVKAHSLVASDPGVPCPEMVELCSELLKRAHRDHPDNSSVESPVRAGDVYALLVEYYEKLGQHENAYGLMERMQQDGVDVVFYVESTLVEKICRSVGRDSSTLKQQQQRRPQQKQQSDVDDDVGYAVDEDLE